MTGSAISRQLVPSPTNTTFQPGLSQSCACLLADHGALEFGEAATLVRGNILATPDDP
jgi:hypothetical protein